MCNVYVGMFVETKSSFNCHSHQSRSMFNVRIPLICDQFCICFVLDLIYMSMWMFVVMCINVVRFENKDTKKRGFSSVRIVFQREHNLSKDLNIFCFSGLETWNILTQISNSTFFCFMIVIVALDIIYIGVTFEKNMRIERKDIRAIEIECLA